MISGPADRILAAAFALLITAAPGWAQPYLIGPGDTLAVSVYGDAGLSGDFAVDSDGSISVPLLGAVTVADKSLEDVRQALTTGLAPFAPSPAVTVRMTSYAPVYVVGEVTTPGVYDFRPGMTTLQLIALAGGLRRGADGAESGLLRTIALEGDHAELVLRLTAQEVKIARLEAELNQTEFSYTPQVQLRSDADAVRRAVENEKRLFDLRRTGLQSADAGIAAQIAGFDEQIATLTENTQLYQNELDLLSEDVKAAKTLIERNVSTPARLREILREQSASRRNALELQASLASARQGRLDALRRREELGQTFRTDAATQLRDAELEAASLRERLSNLRKSMAAFQAENLRAASQDSATQPEYTIVRPTATEAEEISATERTEIRPRDTLRVTVPQPDLDGAQKS